MLANISPCISILFRKWLSGFEAAWSSIASDSQPGCHCPLHSAGLLLTNPAHRGRDEDAPLSVPLAFLVTFEKDSSGLSGVPCTSPRAHLESGELRMSLQEHVCCILKPRFARDLCWLWPARPAHQS